MPVKKRVRMSGPALPRVSHATADAVQDYLMESYGMSRPPDVAARLLALIVELHRSGQPFPSRQEVADALGCTKWGVDAALSVALSRELVRQEIDVTQGNVSARESVLRLRRYVPCTELVSVVNRAQRATVRAA